MNALDEREAVEREIAAWLRGEVETDYTDPEYDIGRNLADAIERGAYRKDKAMTEPNPADVLAEPVADEVADCISRGEALIALERVAHETADDLPEDCTVNYALLVVMNRCYQAINLLNFKDTRAGQQAQPTPDAIAALEEPSPELVEVVSEAFLNNKKRDFTSIINAMLAAAALHLKENG